MNLPNATENSEELVDFSEQDSLWEKDGADEQGVISYFFHSASDTYMLTQSRNYCKIIVKGSTKDKNITLFRGRLSTYEDLYYIMELIEIPAKLA